MRPETEYFTGGNLNTVNLAGGNAKIFDLSGGKPPVLLIVPRIPQVSFGAGNLQLVIQRISPGKFLYPVNAFVPHQTLQCQI